VRALGEGMDRGVVAAIDARLQTAARDHHVTIPWAIESGSRAWGFPSPDSDYDCRFLFIRSLDDYASPWRPRNVIETPLDPVLDVNGWDLIKAVQLAVNGNATVSEWLRSPIVYDGDPAFRDRLLAVVGQVADRAAIGRHYLHVGRDHWRSSGAEAGGECHLKRVFYALRPAAALHWMAHHEGSSPPMNLGELLASAPPPEDVGQHVAELVATKALTRELGRGRVPEPVRGWVNEQFTAATGFDVPPHEREDRRNQAHREFLALVRVWGPRE
jgi:predicted nucleotidyltransferase